MEGEELRGIIHRRNRIVSFRFRRFRGGARIPRENDQGNIRSKGNVQSVQ